MTRVRAFLAQHPQVSMWIALAVGMSIMTLLAARGKGLLPLQQAGLVAACLLLAAGCVWIVGWEGGQRP